jgi:MtN3 and saliva related transmembrane protein
MEGSEAIGLVAGALTTASFVPQVIKTWRTQRAADFSLPMLLMFVAGIILWLIYGLMIRSVPVALPNVITLGLAAYILGVKLTKG